MTLTEIFEELPRLSAEDRLLRQELEEKYLGDFEETSEMLAAIDEGLRSAEEEPMCTIEDLREDMRKWNLGSR